MYLIISKCNNTLIFIRIKLKRSQLLGLTKSTFNWIWVTKLESLKPVKGHAHQEMRKRQHVLNFLMYLLFQVTQTDISIVLHLHDLYLVASHLSTGWISAMSWHGNEAHLKGKSCCKITIFIINDNYYNDFCQIIDTAYTESLPNQNFDNLVSQHNTILTNCTSPWMGC